MKGNTDKVDTKLKKKTFQDKKQQRKGAWVA